MLLIHPIHRRLADLALKARRLGGFDKLPYEEMLEVEHCFIVNADIVHQMDSLKELSFLAFEKDDADWQHDICRQIDALEAKCL